MIIHDIDIKIRWWSTIHDDLGYPSFIDRESNDTLARFSRAQITRKRMLSSR